MRAVMTASQRNLEAPDSWLCRVVVEFADAHCKCCGISTASIPPWAGSWFVCNAAGFVEPDLARHC